MPPSSGKSAVRMMRWWADEFDRLRQHGRVIKRVPEEKRVARPLVRHVGIKERQK